MPGNGGEGGGEADVQRPRLLCEHLEAAGVDEVGIAVEQEQPPGRRCGAHGVEHVGERGSGEPGRFVWQVRRAEAGLDPARNRCLGQYHQCSPGITFEPAPARGPARPEVRPTAGSSHRNVLATGAERRAARLPTLGAIAGRRTSMLHCEVLTAPAIRAHTALRAYRPSRGLQNAPGGGDAALSSHVLVLDDDPTVTDVVRRYLEREGYRVRTFSDGRAGLADALVDPPTLLVLDLMLPGLDGLEVFRRLREEHPVPVLMLTARGDEADRVAGLELGADEYLTKPFSPRELVLRVAAVLRRTAPSPVRGLLTDGDLVVNLAAREARRDGKPLALTFREFDLLAFLLQHPREAFDRSALLQQVWSWSFGDASTVTVHVRRLREKVEDDPSHPKRIVTVFGIGYRYEPREDPR